MSYQLKTQFSKTKKQGRKGFNHTDKSQKNNSLIGRRSDNHSEQEKLRKKVKGLDSDVKNKSSTMKTSMESASESDRSVVHTIERNMSHMSSHSRGEEFSSGQNQGTARRIIRRVNRQYNEMTEQAARNNKIARQLLENEGIIRSSFGPLSDSYPLMLLDNVLKEEKQFITLYIEENEKGGGAVGTIRSEFAKELVRWFIFSYYELRQERPRDSEKEGLEGVLLREGTDHLSIIYLVIEHYSCASYKFCSVDEQNLQDIRHKWTRLIADVKGLLKRNDQRILRRSLLNKTRQSTDLIDIIKQQIKNREKKKEAHILQSKVSIDVDNTIEKIQVDKKQKKEQGESLKKIKQECLEAIKKVKLNFQTCIVNNLSGEAKEKLLENLKNFSLLQ